MSLLNPLTGKPFEKPAAPPPEAVEIYPSELPKIKATMQRLQNFWNQKMVDEPSTAAEAFNQMAANEFQEIGFEIEVNWLQAQHNPFSPGVPLYVPEVNISGRTRKETEIDHDRMKHDIVTGKADGRAGYIREDGSEHEDPIKKIIV
ncbi:hypothetical protein SEA_SCOOBYDOOBYDOO_211 [Mycobacterium phage ScoobyDoobyDoo]|nr:hypothetical protein SEA_SCOOBYDOOBYDOO_211 [Mycobacterium phage ScoobyDoobyDoo]